MRLLAISDLHVGFERNRRALEALPEHRDDWLIVAGDVGETHAHMRFALEALTRRFAKVFWVPGNHELWTMGNDAGEPRGEARYASLVALCRELGVHTPEDPYLTWPGPGGPHVIAPLFLLYDYSFRPDDVPRSEALAWALETGLVCSDEALLHPDPYPSREAWCAARCEATARRLAALPDATPTVLINHFPLLRDQAVLPAVPRFTIWCGTRLTEDWPARFRARVVVYGHLHIRRTHLRQGVRYEEVSLGYPRQWNEARGLEDYLRVVLPGPA